MLVLYVQVIYNRKDDTNAIDNNVINFYRWDVTIITVYTSLVVFVQAGSILFPLTYCSIMVVNMYIAVSFTHVINFYKWDVFASINFIVPVTYFHWLS